MNKHRFDWTRCYAVEPVPALYQPYEFTLVSIYTGNVDPFVIEPEQSTVSTVGLTRED